LTCIVVGGAANDLGAAFGAILVITVVINGVQYLPVFSYTTAAEALQLVAVGLLIIVFLWFRPAGIFRERRRRFAPDRGQVEAGAGVSAQEHR
jgi:branched-chain amino acid transport system permease protein